MRNAAACLLFLFIVATVCASACAGGVTIRMLEVTRSDDATLLAEGWTTHVATDREGAPRRLPARLLDRLETATVGESA